MPTMVMASAGADLFPDKTTRAEREFAMDAEVKWSAAAAAAGAPVDLEEYDEAQEQMGHRAGLPRDLADVAHQPLQEVEVYRGLDDMVLPEEAPAVTLTQEPDAEDDDEEAAP